MTGLVGGADQRAQHADHVQDLRDRALVEGMNGDTSPDQRGDDVRLQVGEAEDEVGTQIEDLRDIRRGECRDPRFCRGAPRAAARNNLRFRRCGPARPADIGF